MENKNDFRNGTSIRPRRDVLALVGVWLICGLLAWALVGNTAHAQTAPGAQTFGEKIWWKSDPYGMRAEVERALGTQATQAVPAGGGVAAKGVSVRLNDGQMPSLASKAKLPGSPGPVIDVSAKVKAPSVAKAIKTLAGKLITPIAIGSALYDFAKELGFTIDVVSKTPSFSRVPPGACTVAPCSGFRTVQYAGTSGEFFPTKEQACQPYVDLHAATRWQETVTMHQSAPQCIVKMQHNTTNVVSYGYSDYQEAAMAPVIPTPATLQDFEDAIAVQSGWPASSAIGRAIADAITNGQSIATEIPSVTGPSSAPGPTSTKQNADGSTTAKSTTFNYTYNDNKVGISSTTSSTNFNPSTGATTTETETEEKPVEEGNECEKNPNSLNCAELDTPEEKIPTKTETVTYSEENLFGSGSCPADLHANIATLGKSIKVWNWTKTCEQVLPLRALVISLATFAALLIVMPGGAKT